MASSIGSLVVSLGLDASSYFSGLAKSEQSAKKSMSVIESSAGAAGTALRGLLGIATLAGGAAVAMGISFVNAAADLDDLAERTGASVEELSRLAQQAYISGTAMETVEGAITKMTKGLNESDEGAKKTQRALAALGLSVEELRKKDPAVAFREVALRLNDFNDSGQKSALMMDLMGKSATQVASYMKDLANDEELAANVTKEQAAQAEELQKEYRRTILQVKNLAQGITLDLLPGILKNVQEFRALVKESGFLEAALIKVGQAFAFVTRQTETQKLGKKAAELDDQIEIALEQLQTGTSKPPKARSWANFLLPNMRLTEDNKASIKKRVEEMIAERDEIMAKMRTPDLPVAPKPDEKDKKDLDYKPLPDESKIKAAAEALRRLQEQQAKISLSIITENARREDQLLDIKHQNNLISEKEYLDEKIRIQQTAVDAEIKLLTVQLNREQELVAAESRKGKNTKEYYDAVGRAEETLARRNKLEADHAHFVKITYAQAELGTKRYKEQVEQLNAEMEELKGNTVEAARLRAELQDRAFFEEAGRRGDTGTQNRLRERQAATVAQAQFNKAQQETSDIQTRLQIQEERIQNSLKTGAISEITALKQTEEARKSALKQMEAFVVAQEKLARDNPGIRQLQLDAEQARLAFERLAIGSNLLAEKFDTIFKDAASDALADFVTGAKTAEEAMKSFADTVVREITRIAAQDISTSIAGALGFGGGAGASSPGSWLAGLFGGGGGGRLPSDVHGPPAPSSNIFGSLLSGLTGIFGFATGSDFVPHDMLAKVHRGERIIPANQNSYGGALMVMNVYTDDANSFHASRNQIGADLALMAARSRARDT